MIQTPPETGALAGAAGSGDVDCLAAIGTSDKPPARKYQAENLIRLVPRSRPVRLAVRISVADGLAPYGRAGPFRLTHDDVDELIAHALRLERRRA